MTTGSEWELVEVGHDSMLGDREMWEGRSGVNWRQEEAYSEGMVNLTFFISL